jgi:hypothetical protein
MCPVLCIYYPKNLALQDSEVCPGGALVIVYVVSYKAFLELCAGSWSVCMFSSTLSSQSRFNSENLEPSEYRELER